MTGSIEAIRYSTEVYHLGDLVPQFVADGMLILFAEGAPAELHGMCALHRPSVVRGGISPGDVLRIDNADHVITAVGDVANENLVNLGHISIKANGASAAPLPGDVCVSATSHLAVRRGSTLQVVTR